MGVRDNVDIVLSDVHGEYDNNEVDVIIGHEEDVTNFNGYLINFFFSEKRNLLL